MKKFMISAALGFGLAAWPLAVSAATARTGLAPTGAAPGKHGFHIHEKGDCTDAGKAAGDHFNPDKVRHGDLEKAGLAAAHAGDLGNIEIGADGKGRLEKTLKGLSVAGGKYAVQGRAVVLHEKADDFGQPAGNAGSRVACGVIPSSGG